jgi:hypothetical protein
MEKSLLWQVLVSQASRRLFQCSRKILYRFCTDSNSEKVWSFVSVRTPINVEKLLNSSRLHSSGRHGNMSGRSSEFEKIPEFLCRHKLGRQPASVRTTGQRCPDAFLDKKIMCRQFATVRTLGQHCTYVTLIWKHVKCVMERWLHSSPSGRSMLPSRRDLEKSEIDSF